MKRLAPQTHRPHPTLSPLASSIRLAVLSIGLTSGAGHAATLTVDSLRDNGDGNKCTLREAIISINQGSEEVGCIAAGNFGTDDEILFAPSISANDAINLTAGQLVINRSMQINGPAADLASGQFPLMINASLNSRVFDIFPGPNPAAPMVQMGYLSIRGGNSTGYGGAILVNTGSSLALSNSAVQDNTSALAGGGIDVRNSSSATLDRIFIEGNTGVNGGAISVRSSAEVLLFNSTVNSNQASSNGGGVSVSDNSYIGIKNTTFYSNSASAEGGGIHGNESDLEITNTTVSANSVGSLSSGIGGGIAISNSGFARLRNITVTGNSAGGSAGGLYLNYADGFLLANSIVAGNRAGSSAEIEDNFETSTIVASNNVLGDSSEPLADNAMVNFPFGGSNITATADGTDPTTLPNILSLIGDNGGESNTHALVVGSPAIDAADNAVCAAGPINGEDQRAFPRPIGGGCDIGAVEASLPATITVNTSSDTSSAAACNLRDAILSSNTNTAHGGCTAGSDLISNIVFDSAVFAGDYNYLNVAAPLPLVSAPLTVTGEGPNQIIISGDGNDRVFEVFATSASFNGLRIRGGDAQYGAGIYASGGATVNLGNVDFLANYAVRGAGILARDNSTVNINNSTVRYNSASNNGSGIYVAYGELNILNSTIYNNLADGDGSGVFVSGSHVAVSNTTISGNTAVRGGGFLGVSSTTTITNSTISENTATTQGGGLVSASADFEIRNSIIAGNVSPDGAEISHYSGGTTITTQYNLLGDSRYTNAQAFSERVTPSASDITATIDGTDPTALQLLLRPLADNGGITQTHALVPDSLAIDAGDAALCNAAPVNDLDQRGRSRTVSGVSCDIGAFELALATATISVDTTDDTSGTPSCSLRDAITSANRRTATGGCTLGGDFETSIVFDESVFNNTAARTITVLNTPLPTVTSDTTISAPINRRVTIDANQTGAALYVYESTLGLHNLNITGGSTYRYSGGLFLSQSNVSLENCRVFGNEVTGGYGGGVSTFKSTLHLNNSVVSDNSAARMGGGISAIESSVTLQDSSVFGNTAYGYINFTSTPTGIGGGVSLRDSSLNSINSTVSDNYAREGGGIVATMGSSASITNSTVSGNSTQYYGAGVMAKGASQLDILNATITSNTAEGNGGGIWVIGSSSLKLNNALVAGNSATSVAEIGVLGTGTDFTGSHNLVGDNRFDSVTAFSGLTLSSSDITATNDGTMPTALASILAPLANNGGPTQTHNLVANSPAINGGDIHACMAPPVNNLDQRGRRRSATTTCDIGSVEFEQPSTFFVVPLPNGGAVTFEL